MSVKIAGLMTMKIDTIATGPTRGPPDADRRERAHSGQIVTNLLRNLFSWDTVVATACHTLAYYGVADLAGHQMGLAVIAEPRGCAKRVFIAVGHNQRSGAPHVLERYTLPITASGVVEPLATDRG